MKRVLIFLLFLLPVMGMSSCSGLRDEVGILYQEAKDYGDTGGLSLPIDIHHNQISILVPSEYHDLGDKLVMKELSKRTGLELHIISTPTANLAQKTRTLLASNELPDILNSSLAITELNNLGVKGIFAPVNQYFSDLPNFNRLFIRDEERNQQLESLIAKDGNLYSFPRFDYEREVKDGFFYRKDLFEAHGIPLWSDPQGFYHALKQLKELYPDSHPYVSKLKNEVFSAWATGWGIDFPGMFYDQEEKRWRYSGTDPRFYEMLLFMRSLYREQLIADDFLISTPVSWEARMKEEHRVFVTFDQIQTLDYLNGIAKETIPDYDLRYAPPPGPVGKVKRVDAVGEGPFVLNNDKKLLSFKLLDYLLSPSGIELTSLGIESQTYFYNSDGQLQYLGFSDDRIHRRDLEERYGLFIEGIYRSADRRSILYQESEPVREALLWVQQGDRLTSPAPRIPFAKKDREEIEILLTNLDYNAYSVAANFVLSGRFGEEDFQAWQEKALDLGVQRLEELYNSY